MADDTVKLAGFGYLTKKLQENNIKVDEDEVTSLFSNALENTANDSISVDDFSKVLSNAYNIHSSEVLDTLEEIANSDGVQDLSLTDFEKYQEETTQQVSGRRGLLPQRRGSGVNNNKNVENSNHYIDISPETIKNIPSNALIQTQDGEIKVSDYINSILSSTNSLTEEQTKEYAINFLNQTLSQTKEVFQTQKDSEGIISSGYNFLKELTGLGTSDKDIEKQISKQEEMINALNDALNGKGELSFEEVWKKYTGADYSKEKMDNYIQTSTKYQAIMVGCQYDSDYMENFEKMTGQSVNDVMKDFISCKQDTFGKDFDLENTFEKYQQDQQSFTGKLSTAMSMAGLACTLISFVCPAAGVVLLPVGRTLQLGGMFIDNGLDLIDKATDKDGLTSSEIKDLAIETGTEALGFLAGRKIGGFTSSLNDTVKNTLLKKGTSEIVSKVVGQAAETTSDATLSLLADYTIAQGESLVRNGELLDSSQYWSVDRFLGEGKNQLIAIISGVAQGKVSKYQQTMVETAKAQVLMGDVDSARESIKKSGMKLADGEFDEFVDSIKMEIGPIDEATYNLYKATCETENTKNITKMLFPEIPGYIKKSDVLKIIKMSQSDNPLIYKDNLEIARMLANEMRVDFDTIEGVLNNIKSDDIAVQKSQTELVKNLLSAKFDNFTCDDRLSILNVISRMCQDGDFITKLSDTNRDMFNEIATNTEIDRNVKKALLVKLLASSSSDYTSLTLREKMSVIDGLSTLRADNIIENPSERTLNLDEKYRKLDLDDDIDFLQQSIKHVINPTDVSLDSKRQMFKGFFANNDVGLDNLLSTADFTQHAKDGVPLEYPRSQFLQDLTDVLKTSTQTEQNEIFDKLGISVIKDETGKITGYDGIIDLTKLSTDGTDGSVLSLANRFIKENSVNTGDVEIDNALNSLIQGMPEFINVVGKQQHSTQDLSVDVHILTVLQQAMSNPNYQNLSNQDKFCLKLATIMHDISKAEGVVDEDHPEASALYARDILSKFNLSNEVKDRVYELIKNHHWLKEYNTGSISASQVAAQFRRADDLVIAQIMTEADLKGVKTDGSFYKRFSSALNDENQAPIENVLNKINSTGQMFLTNKVINQSKLPTVEYDGQEYKVVDLTSLPKDFDLSQFGFESGATPENMRIFVHMVWDDSISDLENVYNLSDPSYQGFLCASYVSRDNHNTYMKFNFGVSLETENVNIANAASKNQSSGCGKNFDMFSEAVSQSKNRSLISKAIKQELGLSDSEYSQLYSSIQKYKYISQFDNIPEIKVGDKTFTGTQVKQAILNADELTIKNNPNRHNEVNLYAPKVNAVVAKVSKMEDVPQELLAFAQEHDLPIYLLGN